MLVRLHGKSSETSCDLNVCTQSINLVGYRVHMTYYYMPSFYMAWMKIYITVYEVPMDLADSFHLLKHRTENHHQLVYAYCIFHTCANADMYLQNLPLKVCVYLEQKNQTQDLADSFQGKLGQAMAFITDGLVSLQQQMTFLAAVVLQT